MTDPGGPVSSASRAVVQPEPQPTSSTGGPAAPPAARASRDRAGLGVGLSVTDLDGAVEAGAPRAPRGRNPVRDTASKAARTASMGPIRPPRDQWDRTGLLTRRKQGGKPCRNTRRDSGRMFFRVRASLTERPGALALLATRCGEAGLNILGLQIFPDLGRVTDELVISAPEDWTAGAVAELVSGAGGDEVSVEPCTTHDLIDQPTRWLTAAQDVVADPAALPMVLERAARPAPGEVERDRALAGRRAARPGGVGRGTVRADRPRPVEYDETASGVVARIGGHVVGVAAFALTEGRELTIEVAPAWRRLGLGTKLLTRAASQAAAAGRTRSCCWPRRRTRASSRWCAPPGCAPGSR